MLRRALLQGIAASAALAALPTVAASAQSRPKGLPIEALANTVWIEEFDVSPDGKWVAYKSAKDGTYDIWTAPVDGGAPKKLTNMPGREMSPVYSPDGKWIAFEADYKGVNVRDIWIVPAQGGEPIQLTSDPLTDDHPMWSPDGKTLYYTTAMYGDLSIAAIDVASKKITRIGAGGGSPSLSPDGSMFVFTGNRKPNDDDQSNSDIYVMPITGGAPRLLTADTFNALD